MIIKGFLLLLIPLNIYSQWDVLNSGIGGVLNSMDFVTDNTGWLAGNSGTLLKTEDGGLNWNTIPINEMWDISMIDFIDDNHGWALGWSNELVKYIIIKTHDGGESWSIKYQSEGMYFTILYVISDSVVIAGTELNIMKTIDDGQHWLDISPPGQNIYYASVWFSNDQTGIVTANYNFNEDRYGVIYKTDDGGSAWEMDVLSEFTGIYDLRFFNDSLCYFRAGNKEGGIYLCQTRDTCKTWTILNKEIYRADSYFVLDSNIIFSAMRDTLYDQYLFSSIDAGMNWEKIYSIKNWQLQDFYFQDKDAGVLFYQLPAFSGDLGQIILTSQIDGANWLTKKFSYNFNDVTFLNKDKGNAVGGYQVFHGPAGGDIFSTEDGGKTWRPGTSIPGLINRCVFPDDSIGYLLSQDWENFIYKSADAGNHWTIVYENNFDSTGYEFWANDIFFGTADLGYVAGNYWKGESGGAGILFTSDGGQNWNLKWEYPSEELTYHNLRSVFAHDTLWWAVGDNGLIATAITQDSVKVITDITDLPLNKIFFYDTDNGWITGGYAYEGDNQPLLLKTTNGGINWAKVPDFRYVANDFYFRDALRGCAVGYDSTGQGIILESNDGGDSWQIQMNHLPGPLNALHFVKDYGWAVGAMGLVLSTADGGSNWIEHTREEKFPLNFNLSQNYPNPFNPITIINYELLILNDVELSVYNLLGQKVAILVSKKQAAGYHQVEWDASSFSSGIYYYRLEVGKFRDVKKMVLLR